MIEMGAGRGGRGRPARHFEENEEPADADEERGREANEKQLKQLFTATTKLKSLHRRIEEFEEKLKERPKAILKAKLKSRRRAQERHARIASRASRHSRHRHRRAAPARTRFADMIRR